MTYEFGNFEITDHSHQQMLDDLFKSDGSFVELARLVSLRKEVDFQWTNLQEVDFTDSDLRGYNFTGADLRGSYGVNIIYDRSTLFEHADVHGSPFSFTVFERSVEKRNPDFESRYDLLRRSHWRDQVRLLLDNINQLAEPIDAQLLAMRLFAETNDNITRNDMMRVMNLIGISYYDYLGFLLNICATKKGDVLLGAALRVLSNIYENDKSVFETALRLTANGSEAIQLAAYEIIIKSQYREENKDDVRKSVSRARLPSVRERIAEIVASEIGLYGDKLHRYSPLFYSISFNREIKETMYDYAANYIEKYDRKVREDIAREAFKLVEKLVELGMDLKIAPDV